MGKFFDDLPLENGRTDHNVTWFGQVDVPMEQRKKIGEVITEFGEQITGRVVGLDRKHGVVTVEVTYGPCHGANMSDVVRRLTSRDIDILRAQLIERVHVTDGTCEKRGCQRR